LHAEPAVIDRLTAKFHGSLFRIAASTHVPRIPLKQCVSVVAY